MLLSREHIIASVRALQPTYSSLITLVEYITLFPNEFSMIIDIILKESINSNPYSNLFILYLLNELLNKQIKQNDISKDRKDSIDTVKVAIKDILRRGKHSIEEMALSSTTGFKKSAKELSAKYDEIEKLVYKEEKKEEIQCTQVEETTKDTKDSREIDSEETYLDIEYLENLCKKKDKKKILKYIKELRKLG